MRELYQLVVGEGGCPPDYFMFRMSVAEAEDYVEGLNRRHRQGWEMTRLMTDVVCRILTGDGVGMRFPWDANDDVPDEDELDELRRKAKMIEKELKGRL